MELLHNILLLVEGQNPLVKIILSQGNSNCLETKNKQKCQEDEGIYLSTKLVEIVGYRFSRSNSYSSYNLTLIRVILGEAQNYS